MIAGTFCRTLRRIYSLQIVFGRAVRTRKAPIDFDSRTIVLQTLHLENFHPVSPVIHVAGCDWPVGCKRNCIGKFNCSVLIGLLNVKYAGN